MSGSWTAGISSPRSLQKCNKIFLSTFDPPDHYQHRRDHKKLHEITQHARTREQCMRAVPGRPQPPAARAATARRTSTV